MSLNPKIKFVLVNIALLFTGILAVMIVQFLVETLFSFLNPFLLLHHETTAAFLLTKSILVALASTATYYFFVKYLERREPAELSFSYLLKEAAAGAALGFLMIITVVIILYLLDYLRFGDINELSEIYNGLRIAILSGVVEEVLFRGLVFRLIQKMFGTWFALIISSLLFGFSHLANPNATLWSSTAITIEAGILLGTVYIITNRLWAPIGLHFGWNLTQGGIFNIPVSGHDVGGIIQVRLIGDSFFSGGSFGLENSVIAVILCSTVAGVMLYKAVKAKKIIKPFEEYYKVTTSNLT